MPRTLVVPGVSIEARFDVPPPLPARSGILGAIGVVDRRPDDSPVKAVTTTQEMFDIYGPGTRFSFPEAVSALINGVSQVIVSPVVSAGGVAASVTLTDEETNNVVLLRARAVGPWGNDLAVRVIRTLASDRRTVRRVTIEVLYKGRPIERHDNMVLRPGDDNDLFTVINRDSGVIVAVDPEFTEDLPAIDGARVGFEIGPAVAASGQMTRGGAALVTVEAATAGAAGNRLSIEVQDGRAAASFDDTNVEPSIRVLAATPGAAGAGITVQIADDGAGGINITVNEPGTTARAYNNLQSLTAVVQELGGDPALIVDGVGALLPAPTAAAVALQPTRSVVLREEGSTLR